MEDLNMNTKIMKGIPMEVCTLMRHDVSELMESLEGHHCVTIGVSEAGNFVMNCFYYQKGESPHCLLEEHCMSFELLVNHT